MASGGEDGEGLSLFLVVPRGRLIGKHGKGRDCSVETYAPHACCGTNIGPQAEAARSKHLPDRHPDGLLRGGRTAQSERISNCWRLERAADSWVGTLNRNARPILVTYISRLVRNQDCSIGAHVQLATSAPSRPSRIRAAQSEHMSNRCRCFERVVRAPLSTPHVTVQSDCATSAWPDRGRRRSQADYRDRRKCEPPVHRIRREHGAVC